MASFERRRFPRIFFSDKDEISAYIMIPRKPEILIKASVMDLSEGGIFVTIRKETKLRDIIKGARLILVEIRGPGSLMDVEETEIEIKWLIYNQNLDHIGLGCEFTNGNRSIRELVNQLMPYEISNYQPNSKIVSLFC